MKAVVTRVNSASVCIDGALHGQIGRGFLILLGIGPDDTPALCRKLAEKILGLRVFRDENDKMNRSLADVGGSVLVVSQFTLYGDVSHGRRPSFIGAAKPDLAIPLYASPSANASASRRSTANSARICRSRRKTTGRSP